MSNNRRQFIKLLGATGLSVGSGIKYAFAENDAPLELQLKGNINHSVSRWTYGDLSIEELCQLVKSIGFGAIDLCGPDDWPVLKKYGLDSSMCNGAELNLTDGWADTTFHKDLVQRYTKLIPEVADAGYKNLVCFSGSKRNLSAEQGLENAVTGLQKILPLAKKHKVVLQMELLNSKVDHPDYLADNSAWGIALCKRLDSPNFKLLYDIYHMQIDEGDVIRTIKNNHSYFGHYHTAGVPGRHEIDDSQELNYGAIALAIKETGFSGYLAQEFIPSPVSKAGRAQSLKQAIHICDV